MTVPLDVPQALFDRHAKYALRKDSLASLDPYELQIFAASHPSCLLIGPDALVDAALMTLKPRFRHAAVFLSGRRLELPPRSSSRAATFVIRDVGELDAEQQDALSCWIESAPGRVQVVSTTPTPLWPAVQARSFLASLYYRLNTLTFPLIS